MNSPKGFLTDKILPKGCITEQRCKNHWSKKSAKEAATSRRL